MRIFNIIIQNERKIYQGTKNVELKATQVLLTLSQHSCLKNESIIDT